MSSHSQWSVQSSGAQDMVSKVLTEVYERFNSWDREVYPLAPFTREMFNLAAAGQKWCVGEYVVGCTMFGSETLRFSVSQHPAARKVYVFLNTTDIHKIVREQVLEKQKPLHSRKSVAIA